MGGACGRMTEAPGFAAGGVGEPSRRRSQAEPVCASAGSTGRSRAALRGACRRSLARRQANHASRRSDPAVVSDGAQTTAFMCFGRQSIDLYKDTGLPRSRRGYGFRLCKEHLVAYAHSTNLRSLPRTRNRSPRARILPSTTLLVQSVSPAKLEPLGILSNTDNDTEAACRFLNGHARGDDPRRAA